MHGAGEWGKQKEEATPESVEPKTLQQYSTEFSHPILIQAVSDQKLSN